MIDPTTLPTVAETNATFMTNNPQYTAPSTPPTPAPVSTPNPVAPATPPNPVTSPQAPNGGQNVSTPENPQIVQAQKLALTPDHYGTVPGQISTNPNVNPTSSSTNPSTSGSTNNYLDQTTANQTSYDNALNNFQNTYEGIRTGSIPLTSYEQSQLDATRQSFQAIIDQQKVYNDNLIGGTQVAQETQGLSRYSPEIAMGNIFAAQTEANKKISDLNATMQKSLAEMEQGFRQSDMKSVKDAFDTLTQAKKDKQDTLDKLYTITKTEEDKVLKAGQEQTLSSINQALLSPNMSKEDKKKKVAELIASGKLNSDQMKQVQDSIREQDKNDFDMMMQSNKFSYQQKQDAIDNAYKAGDLDIKQKNLMIDAAKAGLNPAAFSQGGSGSSTLQTISTAQKNDMLSTVNLVSNILSDPELKYVTGIKSPGAYFGGFFGRMYGSDTIKVQNEISQLTSLLSLDNRTKLKGSGAISDFESRTLEKSASAFSTGLSDDDARHELVQIKGALSQAAGLSVPVKITDPKTGKYDVRNLSRSDLNAAISDGAVVEYQ